MIKYFGDSTKVNNFGVIAQEDIAEIVSDSIENHLGFDCLLQKTSLSNRKVGSIVCIGTNSEGHYIVENFAGCRFKINDLKIFKITCQMCGNRKNLKWHSIRYHAHKKVPAYKCQSCWKTGKGNPFFGKRHTDESKRKAVESYGDRSGSNNPFWGKHHSEKTKATLKKTSSRPGESNPFYGKTHPPQIRRKLSLIGKRRCENPSERARMRKMAIDAHKNQRYRMTKPEKLVKRWLTENKIPHHYNFILDKYQFDFKLLDSAILIEVNGDYWHGNPEIYPKNKLNDRQKFKIKQDVLKKTHAENHGYAVLYIWEKDIKENNFSALEFLKGKK